MNEWRHEHEGGTFYKHECAEQNEGTKCVTRFESKKSDVASRGWGFDGDGGEAISIAYCPYCGEKLEPLDVKIEVPECGLRNCRKAALLIANSTEGSVRAWAQCISNAIEAMLND